MQLDITYLSLIFAYFRLVDKKMLQFARYCEVDNGFIIGFKLIKCVINEELNISYLIKHKQNIFETYCTVERTLLDINSFALIITMEHEIWISI